MQLLASEVSLDYYTYNIYIYIYIYIYAGQWVSIYIYIHIYLPIVRRSNRRQTGDTYSNLPELLGASQACFSTLLQAAATQGVLSEWLRTSLSYSALFRVVPSCSEPLRAILSHCELHGGGLRGSGRRTMLSLVPRPCLRPQAWHKACLT